MEYRVEFRPAAQRALHRLPQRDSRRILARIAGLSTQPLPPGAKKLTGTSWYRIRVGDYRVVYAIENQQLLILVIRIGHRREVYRDE
jgi:mRNA interferase RelE/StbE